MSNTYQKRKASKEYGLYNQCKKLNDDELFRLLDDHNSLKRISSARVLQLRGGQDAVRLAIEFCSDKNYIRRDIGAFILGQMRIPLYSITDWHRSPISDSHPFDQPGT